MFEIMSGTIPILIHIPHDSIAIPNELIDGCEFALRPADFDTAVKKMADVGDMQSAADIALAAISEHHI